MTVVVFKHEFPYQFYRFLYCAIKFRLKTKHVQSITSELVELRMNEEIPYIFVRTYRFGNECERHINRVKTEFIHTIIMLIE